MMRHLSALVNNSCVLVKGVRQNRTGIATVNISNRFADWMLKSAVEERRDIRQTTQVFG
jgi:hypothetical protein